MRYIFNSRCHDDGSDQPTMAASRRESWASFPFGFSNPINPSTILEPQDQKIGRFIIVQEHHTTEMEAPKLWKGWSGSLLSIRLAQSATLFSFGFFFTKLRNGGFARNERKEEKMGGNLLREFKWKTLADWAHFLTGKMNIIKMQIYRGRKDEAAT